MKGGYWWRKLAGCEKYWEGPEEKGYETRLPERSCIGQQVTLVDKIRKRRLTWFGHVTRMEGNRLPVVALYGQVEGTRSRGRQSKKWIDNVKEDLNGTRNEHERSGGQQQEQKDLEKSC